jgi:hypothetical protein
MGQTRKVSGRATKVGCESGTTYVQYHDTRVVQWDDYSITLRSGGWETTTTKARMAQASNQFKLRFYVFQKDFNWYVKTPAGETVEFYDGITFPRATLPDNQSRTLLGDLISAGNEPHEAADMI